MTEDLVLQCQEGLAVKIAAIRGAESTAALALRELRQRKAQGEPVMLFFLRGDWLVGTMEYVNQARAAAATPGRRAMTDSQAA